MSLLQTERALHTPFHILSRCPKTSDQSCKMLIPDTLFYQHGSLRIWYASDHDNGEVIKRDKRECTKEHILEVFCQDTHQPNKSGGGGHTSKKPLPGMPVAIYRHYNASLLAEDHHNLTDAIGGPFSGDAEPLSVDYFDCDLLHNFLTTRENKHNVLVQRFVLNSSQHASTVQVVWSPHRCIPMVRQNINNIMDVQVPLRDRCATDESCAFSREVKSTPKMKTRMESVCKEIVEHWEKIEQRQITRMVLFFCFNREKKKDPVFMWAPEIQLTINQLTTAEASHKAQFNTKRSLLQLSPPILRSDVQYGGATFNAVNSRTGPATAQTRQAQMRGKLTTQLASLLSGPPDVEKVLNTLDRTFAQSRKCAPIVPSGHHSSTGEAARTPWERREEHRRKLEARAMEASGGDIGAMIYGPYAKRPQSALSGPKIDGRKSPSYMKVLSAHQNNGKRSSSTLSNTSSSTNNGFQPVDFHRPGSKSGQRVPHVAVGTPIGARRALLAATVGSPMKGERRQTPSTSPCTNSLVPDGDEGRESLSSPGRSPEIAESTIEHSNTVQSGQGTVSHILTYAPYLHREIGDCLIKLGSFQALLEVASDLTHTLSTHRPGSGGEAFSFLSQPLPYYLESELRLAISPTDPEGAFSLQDGGGGDGLQADSIVAVKVATAAEARAVSRRLKGLEKACQLLHLELRMKLLADLYIQVRSEALEHIPTTEWSSLRDAGSHFARAQRRYQGHLVASATDTHSAEHKGGQVAGGKQIKTHRSLNADSAVSWSHTYWTPTDQALRVDGEREGEILDEDSQRAPGPAVSLSDLVEELLLCVEQDFERDLKMYQAHGGEVIGGALLSSTHEKTILAPVPDPQHNLRAAPTSDSPRAERPTVGEANIAIMLAYQQATLINSSGPLTNAQPQYNPGGRSPLTPPVSPIQSNSPQLATSSAPTIRFPLGLSKYPVCLPTK